MKRTLFALVLAALTVAPAFCAEEMGNKEAKVAVKAFLPTQVDCHKKTIGILREIVQKEPDRVFVQIYELRTPECDDEMQKFKITCASVFVNGKYQFSIPRNGKTASIEMSHKPNEPDSSYNSEDVKIVIAQAIREAYGTPPAFAPISSPQPSRQQAPQPAKNEYGPRSAKVKMLVFLPKPPQQQPSQGGMGRMMMGGRGNPVTGFRDYLTKAAEAYPGKVYLRFLEIDSDQGRAEMKRRGLGKNVYILINNQYKFRVSANDPDLAYRDVQLIGFPGNAEAPYMQSDLKKAMDMAVKKAYKKK